MSILFCNCSYSDVVDPEVKGAVLERLLAAGVAFEAVADLCGLAARRDPLLERVAQAGNLAVAACFPRAVKWLFASAGAPLPDGARVFNMRARTADEILPSLIEAADADAPAPDGADVRRRIAAGAQGEWVPWFPVIDRSRCTGCKQCMGFCLFGVYEVSDNGDVEVRNPANCKTNCPACARICPTAAIIFPKYKAGPINGDEAGASASEPTKVNVAELVRGDVYEVLRGRSRAGAAPTSEEMDAIRAAVERGACSCECSQCPCDPASGALMSLPTAGASSLPGAAAKASQCDCDCDCDCKE